MTKLPPRTPRTPSRRLRAGTRFERELNRTAREADRTEKERREKTFVRKADELDPNKKRTMFWVEDT